MYGDKERCIFFDAKGKGQLACIRPAHVNQCPSSSRSTPSHTSHFEPARRTIQMQKSVISGPDHARKGPLCNVRSAEGKNKISRRRFVTRWCEAHPCCDPPQPWVLAACRPYPRDDTVHTTDTCASPRVCQVSLNLLFLSPSSGRC